MPLFIFNKRPSSITQKILDYFNTGGVYIWMRTEKNGEKCKIILYKYSRFGLFEWRETTGQIQCDKNNLLVDKNMMGFLNYAESQLCKYGYDSVYINIDNSELSIYDKLGYKRITKNEKNKSIDIYKKLECEKKRRDLEEALSRAHGNPQITFF